jgi:GNAT superfamily N-acetyltransferase
VKLADDVWDVIKQYLHDRMGFDATQEAREWMEKNLDITPFDGGAFVASGNEFDLFVVPEKRGRWRIRSVLKNYLDKMSKLHDTMVVRIYEDNKPSLRLAKGFGFKEVSRKHGLIRLENSSWVV